MTFRLHVFLFLNEIDGLKSIFNEHSIGEKNSRAAFYTFAEMWWCGVWIKFRNSNVRIIPTQFECSAWGQVSESNGISHMKLRGVRPILGQNLIYYQKWSFKERRRGKFQMYMTTNSDHFYFISGPNIRVEFPVINPLLKLKMRN